MRSLPALLSLFFIFVVLAETTDSEAKRAAAPEAKESQVVSDAGCLFVARVSEDEIFHSLNFFAF